MANITRSQGPGSASLERVVDEILSNSLSHFFNDEHWEGDGRREQNRVPVNIYETETAFELELIAPGAKKSDFQLTCTDKVLSVSHKPTDLSVRKAEQRKVIRTDFALLPFHLSFTCDDSIETEGLGARYEDGVLLLTLPKRQKPKSLTQTITIR